MKSVLLLGDSLIEYGDWDALLPDHKTLNRGFAGETAGGLAGRLFHEVENVDEPGWIIILSGTNDLLMGDQSFPAVFETMLPRLRQLCPGTEVLVIGLAPVQMVLGQAEMMNSRLEEISLSAGCTFVDLFEPFHLYCRPVGNPCFLADGVHFSPHGYRVLAEAVADVLNTKG